MAVSEILETAMLYPEYINVLRLLRTWDLRGQNVIPLILALFNAWGAMTNLWYTSVLSFAFECSRHLRSFLTLPFPCTC